MIRRFISFIRNVADRMKESTCSPNNRRCGYGAIVPTTLLGTTVLLTASGCMGLGKPGSEKRFANLSALSGQEAVSTSIGSTSEYGVTSLQPETRSADELASVSDPALPNDSVPAYLNTEANGSNSVTGLNTSAGSSLDTSVGSALDPVSPSHSVSTGYDLSQPVDPRSLIHPVSDQPSIGPGFNPIASPYYTKPTPTSPSQHQTQPESVYQLLEGLEPAQGETSLQVPGSTTSSAMGLPSGEFSTNQPYVVRQFPSGGQLIAAPQQTGAVAGGNGGVTAPPPGTQLPPPPATNNSSLGNPSARPTVQNPANLLSPNNVDPYNNAPPSYAAYQGPRVREADLIINGFPARTGRIMLGGAVNSDAGITGQLTIDERNFDITRWPRSFQDMFSGTAFRGAGQTFRLEAAPGSVFKRYTLQFADPNLLGYLPISMSVSGFLYDRRFDDWDEERLGGRLSFGYRITPDLSISAGVTGQNVNISDPRLLGEPQLDEVLGDNELWSGEVSLKHDTRNTPIQASEGHYLEFSFEEVFGKYEYSRFELEGRQYWLLNERADGSGRQTLSYSTRLGFSGKQTPIFENFFAGGYATLRGFDFRGASPVGATGVEVGGRFQWLNTIEYMFPLTADDAFAGVAFMDFGTVEEHIEINADNFRVAPGVGLRIAIPMLGPAPLAFDFAFPVAKADTDQERVFSFYMSMIR